MTEIENSKFGHLHMAHTRHIEPSNLRFLLVEVSQYLFQPGPYWPDSHTETAENGYQPVTHQPYARNSCFKACTSSYGPYPTFKAINLQIPSGGSFATHICMFWGSTRCVFREIQEQQQRWL